MKLPSRTELSPEQEKIYMEAPLDGTVVITGPPGTGKTVLAVYRTNLLARKKRKYQLVMYNRVLARYTSNALSNSDAGGKISTWHSWIYSWWRQANRGRLPKKRSEIDFPKMIGSVLTNQLIAPEKLKWGHLIVDEGQDFPPNFYLLLEVIQSRNKEAKKDYSLTVLADENQRLSEKSNSTIEQILKNLNVDTPYKLTKNFRNTFEIARFAAEFYTGAMTEIAEFPSERKGGLPVVRAFKTMDDEVRHLARYARLNEDQSIAVFVRTHATRRAMMTKLERLIANTGIRLQSYSSSDKELRDVTKLNFNKGGVITLLCDASCKGLEFDAVFITQMQEMNVTGIAEEFVKMKLYVMSSRARHYLHLSWSDCDGYPEVALLLMPSKEKGFVEWQEIA